MTELARSELRRASLGRPTALTIGVFDGVHRGHQIVLKHVVESARTHGEICTFSPAMIKPLVSLMMTLASV